MEYKDNIFKKFYKCLYNVDSFSKYAKQGIKHAILYIISLCVVLGTIKGIVMSIEVDRAISNLNTLLEDSTYNFHIDYGSLNISKSPIKFEENNIVIYIDDEKSISQEDELINEIQNSEIGVMLLEDGVVISKDSNTIEGFKYSKIFNKEIIDRSSIKKELDYLKVKSNILICILNILIISVSYILNLLIVVIVGRFISLFLKMVVKYSALWSLIIYSSTLPLVLTTILEIIRPDVNFSISFILGNLTYLLIILIDIKSDIIEKIKSGKL